MIDITTDKGDWRSVVAKDERSLKENGSADSAASDVTVEKRFTNEDGAPRYSVLWKKSGLREDLPEEDVPVVALEEFLSKRRSDRVKARHQDS